MHVPLRRAQIAMPGEFLNRQAWRASHRQMRTERVTQDVHAAVRPTIPLGLACTFAPDRRLALTVSLGSIKQFFSGQRRFDSFHAFCTRHAGVALRA